MYEEKTKNQDRWIHVEINKEDPLTCRKDKIKARETSWRIMLKELGS